MGLEGCENSSHGNPGLTKEGESTRSAAAAGWLDSIKRVHIHLQRRMECLSCVRCPSLCPRFASRGLHGGEHRGEGLAQTPHPCVHIHCQPEHSYLHLLYCALSFSATVLMVGQNGSSYEREEKGKEGAEE